MPLPRPLLSRSLSLLLTLSLSFLLPLSALLSVGSAQTTANATGSITGRVLAAGTDSFLERVRVTVEGTSLETFTDAAGAYRFESVPVGTARVKLFYTGMTPVTTAVAVAAGQSALHDVTLTAAGQSDPTADRVKLATFVVSTSKEMEASAIAINEQRFAANLKTVVSTDEFGTVAEGHVGEFLKFLPGVTMEYAGGNAREISINGAPADNVPVTLDGFSLATAISGISRASAVDMVSINGLSRIEVSFSPTPDTSGAALAGSVNMIPRSAFERSRPVFNGSVYVMMRDHRKQLHATPGPREDRRSKAPPGFDFSWVVPINKRFGFTLSGGRTTQFAGQDQVTNTWRGAGTVTNGTTFPHTTPDQPYLSTFAVRGGLKQTTRHSLSATLDFKFARSDTLSLSIQASRFEEDYLSQTLTFNVGGVLPGNFTPFSTRGTTALGDLVSGNAGGYRKNQTYLPTLRWRHDGPVWKAEAGAGYSRARYNGGDLERGYFANTSARRTGVTVAFDDIFYLRPNRITVNDGATGTPLDPYSLNHYAVTGAGSGQPENNDQQRTLFANVQRDVLWRVPVTLKAGLDRREGVRDLRADDNRSYSFVGRDGRASTTPVGTDDAAAPFWAPELSERAHPYGLPRIQWVGTSRLLDYYRANPTHLTFDENARYRASVTNSKHTEEAVSSAFLRGDVALFERRLKLVGGLRAEQTNIEAEGALTDATRNYQRDASGRVLRAANGTPLLLFPTTNALAVSQLTFLQRGTHVEKEYLRLFPSLNASFNLRENLIVRAARYFSVGRPDLNQYAGGLTLPDPDSDASNPANRIVVNNAGIKAWSAETTNARFEYYFAGVGQISVGGFRRDITNFFGGTVFNATPEFLALYGLDPALYDKFDVTTQYNLPGKVRLAGVDFSYKQALTGLPSWARGVQVFANASAQRVTGDTTATANFAGYIPRSGSWGVSLTRPGYNLRINWNYRGRQRRAIVATGASIEPGTYNWGSKRLYLDVSGEYSLTRRLALFTNLRNLNDATEDTEISGPNTPAHAQFRSRLDFGSLWTFGLKGTF
jgi:TonB-dependent receptor